MYKEIVPEAGSAYDEILRYYNEKTSFGRQETINEDQKEWIDRTLSIVGLENFKKGLLLAEESDYLTGRKGCEWHANFDWLIKPQNMLKVLNGNYRDFKYKSKNYILGTYSNSSYDPDEFADAALNKGFD